MNEAASPADRAEGVEMNGYQIVAFEVLKARSEAAKRLGFYQNHFMVFFECRFPGQCYTTMIEHCYFDHDRLEWSREWFKGQEDIEVIHVFALEEIEDLIKENERLREKVNFLENKIQNFAVSVLRGE